MPKKKYIEALVGWKGYRKSELLEGRYRPIFFSSEGLKLWSSKTSKEKRYTSFTRVPATKENLIKTAYFNINYGDDAYQEAGKKLLKKLGMLS